MKDLIRQGRYMEALGENYVHESFYIIDFINGRGEDPIHITKDGKDLFFSEKANAHKYAKENCIDYMICDLNADWL